MLTLTVCAALSAAGLAIAFLTAWRRRFVRATRIAAVALLPIGLALSGLLGLAGEVGRAAGSWAADLVVDPQVWTGFAVLALAVVLYVAARFAGARSARRGGGRAARRAESPAGQGAQSPAERSRPAVAPANKPPGGGEDFSEIEAILKKHGI
ncbi:hypothetical protein JJV70_19135 [Streptomyces sp. JJ66]|uniref:hypothetical protein n=1 Tax=Streptomyces sp. JJ66 TaxID=2803843 RepID=UPI001C592E96|nr:hypothetical protein [Streptomyces sp. JJ66]MBW1604179.1 hypothetical protein [Streptomyces sp. JJ66]